MGNAKKALQLGEPFGTASNKLKKNILFVLIVESGRNKCFQCSELIEDVKDLSIEHKEPWLDSEDPKSKFYDLNNIAFSHIKCNSNAARRSNKLDLSSEERAVHNRQRWTSNSRNNYTSEKRREKYLRTGM